MYLKEIAIQNSATQGGPRCVKLEADSSNYSSPEEADFIEIPGSVV